MGLCLMFSPHNHSKGTFKNTKEEYEKKRWEEEKERQGEGS